MKTIRVGIATFLMVAVLSACMTFGFAPPRSFGDRVAYADGTVTAIVNATTDSLKAQQITVDDAKRVREIANQASQFLDAAHAAGDTPEGNAQLKLGLALLSELQSYLNQRSKQ